jgi:PAS domain S-box-containing protein
MTNSGEKLKILFLDDIPTDVEIAIRELQKEELDFEFKIAEDRSGFISLLDQFKPNLVISDYVLPTINGLEALTISLATDPSVPVIILTGSMDEETAVKCMKSGASDYVVKDFIVKLPFAVREALQQRKARNERIDAEQLLEKNEARYRKLFESNPLPMWVYELDTLKFLAVNDAAIIKYGFSAEEFLSMTIKDIRPDEDIPILLDNIRQSTEVYERTGNWRHKLKDGTVIIVEIASHGLIFDGKPSRMVMANDVTQRVNDELEIRKLNRIYSLLSNVNQLIVRITEKGTLLDEICKVGVDFGKFKLVWYGEPDESGEILKVVAAHGSMADKIRNLDFSVNDLLERLSPCVVAIRDSNPVIINNFDEDYRKSALIDWVDTIGANSLACFPIKQPDGLTGVICLYAQEKNFFDENEVILIDGLRTDLAFALEAFKNEKERKEALSNLVKSEARYRKFFDEDLTADYITSVTGEVIDCNKEYISMFGFSDKEHALSTNTIELYSNIKDRAEFLSLIRENKKVERHEISYRTIHGVKIHAILNAFGHYDKDGNLKRIQGYIFDITNIKRAAIEMKQARELAEKSNKLKDSFIANISHEIRTPMNAIIGFNSVIREQMADKIDQETKDYFQVVDEAGARLMRTVDLILSMSKLQAGVMETRQVEIDLDEEIRKIIAQHKPAYQKKSIPVKYTNSTGTKKIVTDDYCFTEVLSNFIDNAIKYTEKGHIDITLKTEKNGDLAVHVTDTGIGIEEKFKEKIFHPFLQEESGYSRSYEGVGLGLSIVKRFADLAGYRLEFESKKGHGSRFTVILPQAALSKVPEKTINDTHKGNGTVRKSPERMEDIKTDAQQPLIFAVEDDEDSQVYLETVLKRKYAVEITATDEGLFRLLEKGNPDVILMDISLRGSRDGLDITRQLKSDERYNQIPVIAVTAHAFQADKINAMEAGCTGFLSKPYSPGDLFKMIESSLKPE